MFVGKVIGTVWSTVKWPEMTGQKLLLVRPYHLRDLRARTQGTHTTHNAPGIKDGDRPSPAPAASPGSKSRPEPEAIEAVVCIDLLDAGVGDDVVVAFGHAARVAAEQAQNEGSGVGSGVGSSGRSGASFGSPNALSKGSAKASTTTPIDAAVVAVVDSFHVA